MPVLKQSDRVRSIVLERYVRPALQEGRSRFSVRARDVLRDAEATSEFSRARTPTICKVLMSNELRSEGGLEIERVEGSVIKPSRTVIVHYKLVAQRSSEKSAKTETPEEWAFRVTEKLRGLMKEEIAAHGGAEGYLRWVRSEDEAGSL